MFILFFGLGLKAYGYAADNDDDAMEEYLIYTLIIVFLRALRFILMIVAKAIIKLNRFFRKKRYRGRYIRT